MPGTHLTPRHILICDETLRDGSQGNVVMTAAFKANHILEMEKHHFADMYRVGWHSNPADQAVLDFFKKHRPDLNGKFMMNTLLYPHEKVTSGDDFDKFRSDDRFGIAYIFTKGRPQDIREELGISNAEALKRISQTVRHLKEAKPGRPIGIGIEHAFASWQEGNADFVLQSCIHALKAGCDRITLADTDGAMMPQQIKEVTSGIIEGLRAANISFDPAMLSVHTHNDLGMAAANIFAGLDAGAGTMDVTLNSYGERAGNAPLLQAGAILAEHPRYRSCMTTEKLPALTQYGDEVHHAMGTSPADQLVGGVDAFNAVGGMHAARLLKAFYQARDEHGVSIEEFIRNQDSYRGSYNSIPAQDFGREITVTLSPVAGRANVQFLLETMHVPNVRKDDPRLQEVLDRVKEGEFLRGENYRGKNNANARLLIAKIFGLRDLGDSGKNTLAVFKDPNDIINRFDSGYKKFDLKVRGKSLGLYAVQMPDQDIPELEFKARVHEFYNKCNEFLTNAIPDLPKAELKDATCTVLETGDITAQSRADNTLGVQSAHTRHSVKLLFSGEEGKWSASGTGETRSEALAAAVQTALDYSVFKYERGRIKERKNPLIAMNALTKAAEKTALTSDRGSYLSM